MSKQTDAIKWAIDNKRYTVDTKVGIIYGSKGKPLKYSIHDPNPTRNRRVDFSGYYIISIYYNKQSIAVPVHKVVAYALYGDIALKKGLHIDHINRNSLDNRGENLRVVTPKQNAKNRPVIDMRKLSQKDVEDIQQMLENNYSIFDIAYSYNISTVTVRKALKGKKAYSTYNIPNATPKQLNLANFWRDVDSGMKKRQLREKYELSHSTLSRRLSRQSGRL